MTLSLFDCLAEGIVTLYVFGHVSGHLALVKSSSSRFQFRANAALNPQFLVWECFNRCYGYSIADALSNELAHQISVFLNVVVGRNAEHIPIHVIEAVLKRGIRLVGLALNRPERGSFLF
jgi:hypothetical protein